MSCLRRLEIDRCFLTDSGLASGIGRLNVQGRLGQSVNPPLAHNVGNGVEQAYMRSDLFEQRRALMQAWADYIAG